MVDRLRQQHALGEAALRAEEEEGKSIADFAAVHPYSEHTIRKLKAFARHYSQADLDELCCGRRSRDQLPLHWGYVSVLLAIEGKHGVKTRKRFQRLALREGWTVPRLYREVRQRLGVSGHGRPMTEPQDVEDGLRMLTENLELLLRRCDKVKDLAKTNSDRSGYDKCRRLVKSLVAALEILATA